MHHYIYFSQCSGNKFMWSVSNMFHVFMSKTKWRFLLFLCFICIATISAIICNRDVFVRCVYPKEENYCSGYQLTQRCCHCKLAAPASETRSRKHEKPELTITSCLVSMCFLCSPDLHLHFWGSDQQASDIVDDHFTYLSWKIFQIHDLLRHSIFNILAVFSVKTHFFQARAG